MVRKSVLEETLRNIFTAHDWATPYGPYEHYKVVHIDNAIAEARKATYPSRTELLRATSDSVAER